jgi:hypothetical protein
MRFTALIISLFALSLPAWASRDTLLAAQACEKGKYLTQCFHVDQKKCEGDFLTAFQACLKTSSASQPVDCTVKDLQIRWKALKNTQIKNCLTSQFVGDQE